MIETDISLSEFPTSIDNSKCLKNSLYSSKK